MGTPSFVLLAYYYITVLYFLTMTAEKAHQALKMLATPLQQALVMETDQPKMQSFKIKFDSGWQALDINSDSISIYIVLGSNLINIYGRYFN